MILGGGIIFPLLHPEALASESASPCPLLEGIVLLDETESLLSGDDLKKIRGGVESYGLNVSGGTQKLKKYLEPLFIHEKLNGQLLDRLKHAIESYFELRQDPFILVVVPPQSLQSGILQLQIIHSKLGRVQIEGNRYFSSEKLRSYVSLQKGEPIDLIRLQKDLNFMNRNPFRHVDIIYSPGEEKKTTDIHLIVQDERPYRFYTGADNTGIETTKRQRLFTGLSWGRVFGLDHIFNFQYTTSYNFKQFQAYTFQYLAHFRNETVLSVYGGYTTVHPTKSFPVKHREGRSMQLSWRYIFPLTPNTYFGHEFAFGIDYKNTNNTVEFSELFENYSSPVNLTQLMVRYRSSLEMRRHRFDLETELFCSPGEWLSNQTDADYNALRPGAKNQWVYLTADLKYLYRLPRDFTCNLWLRGQLSSQNLLPSEQLGIGGHNSVRGYDENQLNMDSGLLTTLELRTPPFSLISFLRKKAVQDALQALVFIDYGFGTDYKAIPGIQKIDYLVGVGPGLRYSLVPYLSARLDWGIKLHHQLELTGGDSMVHFSVSLNY